MSIKSKLLAKTSDLTISESPLPASAPERTVAPDGPPAVASEKSTFPPALTGSGVRTGPGQMLQFRTQMLAVEGEIGKLREQLKAHEGALPARKLDPASVVPSRWANRHADSFASAKYLDLKNDIAAAGGNVQPILVRPRAGEPDRYEVVFGHRRHRACAELGLPVLAVIDSAAMSDLDLFSAMDRENRARADLSPYEQGLMYRRALDEGLYPSNRRLAESLGVSHTWVANVLSVADLPPPVIECFRSTLEIHHRHAKALHAALESDRKGVLKRAEKLRQNADRLAPAAVVEQLTASSGRETSPSSGELRHDGRALGRWSFDASGNLQITLKPAVAKDADMTRMAAALAEVLRG